jgi:hypothetical protein
MKLKDDFDGEEIKKKGCWRFIDSTIENVTFFTLDKQMYTKDKLSCFRGIVTLLNPSFALRKKKGLGGVCHL